MFSVGSQMPDCGRRLFPAWQKAVWTDNSNCLPGSLTPSTSCPAFFAAGTSASLELCCHCRLAATQIAELLRRRAFLGDFSAIFPLVEIWPAS